jgi:hypothetical protein
MMLRRNHHLITGWVISIVDGTTVRTLPLAAILITAADPVSFAGSRVLIFICRRTHFFSNTLLLPYII